MTAASSDPTQHAEYLSDNLRALREARGLSQQQIAKLAGIPRATWAHLESGAGNPTLSVLVKVAGALQIRLEELLAPPRALVKHFRAETLPTRQRGQVEVRQLLPEALAGFQIERMSLPPGASMSGIPHTAGTREYLTCERGQLLLIVASTPHTLNPGDVVVFRGEVGS